MHEMALAEGILEVVLEAAGDQKIRKIDLSVGALQLVVPDSLEFSFGLAAAETPAEGAVIQIREIPARLRCEQCEEESEIQSPPFQCRQCGSVDIEMIAGEEVLVDAVELESGEIIRRCAVPADEILAEHMREHHAHGGPG